MMVVCVAVTLAPRPGWQRLLVTGPDILGTFSLPLSPCSQTMPPVDQCIFIVCATPP